MTKALTRIEPDISAMIEGLKIKSQSPLEWLAPENMVQFPYNIEIPPVQFE
jgi:hypothetical protein